jgi:trans-aconitate methyltransferase
MQENEIQIGQADPNGTETWKDVWEQKGLQQKDLHQLDGLDHLSKKQWDLFLSKTFEPVNDFLIGCANVMELGCGAGGALRFIREKFSGIQLNGFDYSESLITVCKEYLDGEFWVDNAQNENWINEDKTYDFVFNVGTCMYLDDESYVSHILEKMTRMSKSGKILIAEVSDKERENLAKNIRKETHSSRDKLVKKDLQHLYVRKEVFVDFAKKNGCKIEIFEQKDICPMAWNLSHQYRYNVLIEKKYA